MSKSSKLHLSPFESNTRELSQRKSTLRNPFMNVGINEYNNAKHDSSMKCDQTCDKNFYGKMFRTPDDYLWSRQSSQRQFITNPNTSIPNKQNEFAQWLYGQKHVGKSGTIYNRYGYKVTPDSLVSTGYNASTPSNAGQHENSELGHLPFVSKF